MSEPATRALDECPVGSVGSFVRVSEPTLPRLRYLAERKVRPGFLKQYDWTFTALAKHTPTGHSHGHGHSHGTIDSSVLRSRAGLEGGLAESGGAAGRHDRPGRRVRGHRERRAAGRL